MLHSYPWYIDDWRGSETVTAMSLEERGLYRELIDHCWDKGSLPTDLETLQRLARATSAEFKRAWPNVRTQFVERDGRLWNAKVDDRRPAVLEAKRAQEQARSSGGKARGASAERDPHGRFAGPPSHQQSTSNRPADRPAAAGAELVQQHQLTVQQPPSRHPAPLTTYSLPPTPGLYPIPTVVDDTARSGSSEKPRARTPSPETSLPAMAGDDGYQDLRDSIESEIPANTFTSDDWARAYQLWNRLDFEQRATARENYIARVRAGTENLTYLKPQLLLNGNEWRRRAPPVPRRTATAKEAMWAAIERGDYDEDRRNP